MVYVCGLGCSHTFLFGTGASVVSTSVFGPGSGPVFLDEVVCSRTEQELMECAHAGIGNHLCGRAAVSELTQSEHEFDVAIMCKGSIYRAKIFVFDTCCVCPDDCEDGEVRLQDGTASSNGRVEVCQNGIWGSVCSSQWDDTDASVVCRELDYDPEGLLSVHEHVYMTVSVIQVVVFSHRWKGY